MRQILGIDNGVTGSLALIIDGRESIMIKTPVILQQNYTKTKQNLNRLNIKEMKKILDIWIEPGTETNTIAIIERPMINPGRFKATISAVRCLEATLCALEARDIPYMYIDSKEWQKGLLPSGCEKDELKPASHDIGVRLFPHLKDIIEKQGDADSILIAEYIRRKGL